MTATDQVAAVETLPLGEPYAEHAAAAERAIAAEHAAAAAIVFPADIKPVSADALSAYVFHTQRIPAAGYGEALARVHERAMIAHPDLAALCRSTDALDDVAAAAASVATPASHTETHASAGARAASRARRAYMLLVARQIAEHEGHELASAARALLAAVDLEARLAAARAAHEAHARAELERAEDERRAAERAVIDKTVERVRAAEAKLAAERAQVERSAEEYRKVRAESLVERLRASGLKSLRVGSEGEVYGVADIIATAPRMSIEQLARYESALAAHEARS